MFCGFEEALSYFDFVFSKDVKWEVERRGDMKEEDPRISEIVLEGKKKEEHCV